jgi:tetratricopeptide (TPR) repeat protein
VLIARAVWTLRVESPALSLPLFTAAVAAAREAGDPRVLARAIGRHATALVYVGRLGEAAGLLSEHERIVFTKAHDLAAEAASFRAQLAAAEGDLGARYNAYLAAVELYGAQGDARNEAGASVNLADAQNRFGAYEDAEVALSKALARCRELRMRLMEGYALVNRGYSRLMRARWSEARTDLEAALAIAIAVGDTRLAIFAVLYRARVAMGEGALEIAIADAERVVGEAEGASLASAELLGRTVLAQALLLRGTPEAAERAIDLARKKRAEIGGVEEDEAELYATHARVLEARGASERAREVRATGRERLSITAQRIGDPALRARFLEGTAAHRELLAE